MSNVDLTKSLINQYHAKDIQNLEFLYTTKPVTEKPLQFLHARVRQLRDGMADGSGYDVYILEGYVLVRNFQYDKKITVRYSGNGHKWFETAATFVNTMGDESELWFFKTDAYADYVRDERQTFRLSVHYCDALRDFWDNNHKQDYVVTFPVGIGNQLVTVERRPRGYTGMPRILVRNDDYEKKIKVYFATENATKIDTVDARYDGPLWPHRAEFWTFNLYDGKPFGEYYNELWFAIGYEVEGIRYKDDNFGRNYCIADGILLDSELQKYKSKRRPDWALQAIGQR